MRRHGILAVLFILSAMILYAGGSEESADRGSEIRLTTAAELKSLMANAEITILDIRDNASYVQGHIPGAELLILDEVNARGSEYISRGQTIVTYCSCPSEESSMSAALRLREMGASSLLVLQGGYRSWIRERNQVITGSRP